LRSTLKWGFDIAPIVLGQTEEREVVMAGSGQAAVAGATRTGRGWAIAAGVLLIIVGIEALAAPYLAALVAALWVAWGLVFGGIADLVSAHLLVLDALAPKTGHTALAYNLGNGAGYSIREVIETARAVTGHPIPVIEQPRRPGDAPRLVAASDRIRQELGWTPQYGSLHAIISTAWEWHRLHPYGYFATPAS
jgi:hypothetical protein